MQQTPQEIVKEAFAALDAEFSRCEAMREGDCVYLKWPGCPRMEIRRLTGNGSAFCGWVEGEGREAHLEFGTFALRLLVRDENQGIGKRNSIMTVEAAPGIKD